MSETQTNPTPPALHHGRVNWAEWGPDAFARAVGEDKLVLVDVGAVWCHWCHVMDRTTYDHEQVARLVNERFVAVRVDRDQRPDIDSRLQRAVPMIQSQGGGWPLTVLLTPAGHVLFKATYLPPTADNRFGTGLGMLDLLTRVEQLWQSRRGEFDAAGGRIGQEAARHFAQLAEKPGQVTEERITDVLGGIVRQFDPNFGGFGSGSGPKFPHPSAVDLLLIRSARGGPDADALRRVAVGTLEAMARGGVHDHLGGGFHRYSVDPYWRVPHFEKMAYDNAPLLGNYARAFALTGEPLHRETAEGVARFTRGVLCNRERGGFYGSQDADITIDDDGDYFTWTLAEVQALLSGDELEAVRQYYGVSETGDMHHAPDRNVLHVAKSVEQLARLMGVEASTLQRRIDAGRRKLLAARDARPTPWIDRTIFTDWNGLYLRALSDAHKLLGGEGWLDDAARAADRLLAEAFDAEGRLAHYLPADGPAAHGSTACRVFGQLADHAGLAYGLLGLYTATGRARYLDGAVRLLDHVVAHLQDREHGGFIDADRPADEADILRTPQKSWEDSPTQSPNSLACLALLEAAELAGRDDFDQAARRALAGFAGAIGADMGLFVAGWALAADRAIRPPPRVVIVARPGQADAFARAAWSATLGAALTEPLDPADPHAAARLAAMNYLPGVRPGQATAFVCQGTSCRPPVQSPDELARVLGST
ncbi:MAG: hypothetical protein BIFFINMI_02071 [Phycisphaerae bacterium]|nr:hypothetical protein [Phycisphaerae bacterium]